MKYMGKMQQQLHVVLWLFLVVLNTKSHGASDLGLPLSKDAQRNSILKLYEFGTANKTENDTVTKPNTEKQTHICQDAINTAIQRCESPMKKTLFGNTTFAVLSEVLFDSIILHDLQNTCTNGTWCLTPVKETQIVAELSQTFLPYCSTGLCLLQMDDACLTKERRLTIASLLLLCRAEELNMSPNCLLSLRKMTHVAMATLHNELSPGNSSAVSSQAKCSLPDQTNCTGSCPQVANQLQCTCASCDHQMHFLKEFGPWQWFFNHDNMEFCGISNTTDCSHFNSPLAVNFQQLGDGGLWQYLQQLDLGVLIAAGIAGGATLMLLSCLLAFCVNRIKAPYNRHYIHYHEITARETDDLTKDAFNDCKVVDLNKVYESID